MRPGAVGIVLTPIAALAGCAGVACEPATIEVAAKDTRTRMVSEVRGITTDPTGRVAEQRRETVIHEYWAQDRAGRWYRVAEAAWRAVEPGQSLAVCR